MSNVEIGQEEHGGVRRGKEKGERDGANARAQSLRVDSIMRIPVVLQVVVGSATLPVADLMKLGRGAVVPLDHRVGDPVDVVVNGRTIARGEVVVVEEDGARFGVSLTEICDSQHEQRGWPVETP